MSREDPQLRIRLPIELKEKIETSSKSNSRSMNAEIVHRLETTFSNEISDELFLSAEEALNIAKNSLDVISDEILKRTFNQINKMVRLGHHTFEIDLEDLQLEGIEGDNYLAVFSKTFKKLDALGYVVPKKAWDPGGFLVTADSEEF